MNYVSWFIVLYFISSYIRLYPDHIWKSDSMKAWGILLLCKVMLAMGSVFLTLWINVELGKNRFPYWLVSESNAILALAVGISSFMFFKNLRIPNNCFINAVGATTFGVFLIHANSDVMRQWLWNDIVDCVGHYNAPHYIIYTILSVLSIFVLCSLLDWIRIQTLEKYVLEQYDR